MNGHALDILGTALVTGSVGFVAGALFVTWVIDASGRVVGRDQEGQR